MTRTLTNHNGPPPLAITLAGVICFVVGIVLVVTRFNDPTTVIVGVAAVLIVAGFSLLINGGLALASRPIWTEGTVIDCRWTVHGARRVGAVVLNTGAEEPFVVQVNGTVFTALAVGDRVRIEHGSLDRTRVSQVELLDAT